MLVTKHTAMEQLKRDVDSVSLSAHFVKDTLDDLRKEFIKFNGEEGLYEDIEKLLETNLNALKNNKSEDTEASVRQLVVTHIETALTELRGLRAEYLKPDMGFWTLLDLLNKRMDTEDAGPYDGDMREVIRKIDDLGDEDDPDMTPLLEDLLDLLRQEVFRVRDLSAYDPARKVVEDAIKAADCWIGKNLTINHVEDTKQDILKDVDAKIHSVRSSITDLECDIIELKADDTIKEEEESEDSDENNSSRRQSWCSGWCSSRNNHKKRRKL